MTARPWRRTSRSGVKAVQADLDEYNQIAMDMTNPDANVDALMKRMDQLQSKLDASNAWELERTVERAMDAFDAHRAMRW